MYDEWTGGRVALHDVPAVVLARGPDGVDGVNILQASSRFPLLVTKPGGKQYLVHPSMVDKELHLHCFGSVEVGDTVEVLETSGVESSLDLRRLRYRPLDEGPAADDGEALAPNQTLAHNQMNLTEFGDQARVLYNNKTKKYVAINRGRIHSLDGARVARDAGRLEDAFELDRKGRDARDAVIMRRPCVCSMASHEHTTRRPRGRRSV